jgi:hypothetical protein
MERRRLTPLEFWAGGLGPSKGWAGVGVAMRGGGTGSAVAWVGASAAPPPAGFLSGPCGPTWAGGGATPPPKGPLTAGEAGEPTALGMVTGAFLVITAKGLGSPTGEISLPDDA